MNDTDELDQIWRDGLRRLSAPTVLPPDPTSSVSTRVRHRQRVRLAVGVAAAVVVAGIVGGVASSDRRSNVTPGGSGTAPTTPIPVPTVVEVVDAANNALTLAVPGHAVSGQPAHVDLSPGLIEFRVDMRSAGHEVELDGVSDFAPVSQTGVSTRTVRLRPGVYRLFCAIPGHAENGEQILLDVH